MPGNTLETACVCVLTVCEPGMSLSFTSYGCELLDREVRTLPKEDVLRSKSTALTYSSLITSFLWSCRLMKSSILCLSISNGSHLDSPFTRKEGTVSLKV